MPHYQEYDVYATYDDHEDPDEECAGSLDLRKITTNQDMPSALEINGVYYYPQF